MKTLILMRHSYAEPLDSNSSDIERALSPKGKLAATEQSKKLAQIMNSIDAIVTSHAQRTIETAYYVKKILPVTHILTHTEFLYHSYTTQEFLNWIHTLDEKYKSLLVIAHNPEISQLSYRLTQGQTHGFQPVSLAILKYQLASWKLIDVSVVPEVHFLQ